MKPSEIAPAPTHARSKLIPLFVLGGSVALSLALSFGIPMLSNISHGTIPDGLNESCTLQSIESYEGDMAFATTSCGTVHIMDKMLDQVKFGGIYDFEVIRTADQLKVGIPKPIVAQQA